MNRGLAKQIMDESFELETDGVNLYVKPADRLTDSLRRFIREHKAEIISELLAANDSACNASDYDHILVECWSPAGNRILDWAHDPAHADWMRKTNPPRQSTNPETAIICATPIAAIRAWLDRIEETDEAVLKEVMERARFDPGALVCYLRCAKAHGIDVRT